MRAHPCQEKAGLFFSHGISLECRFRSLDATLRGNIAVVQPQVHRRHRSSIVIVERKAQERSQKSNQSVFGRASQYMCAD